jgi:hypothetical protein
MILDGTYYTMFIEHGTVIGQVAVGVVVYYAAFQENPSPLNLGAIRS